MFDDFDLGLDDRDCSGNCDTCPYAVWNYDVWNYDVPFWDEPKIIKCKLEE